MSTDTATPRILAEAAGRAHPGDDGGNAPFVPQPLTVEETGLDFSMILDLVVKAIYFAGRPAARQVAAQIALPFPVVDEILTFMKREQMTEVVGSSGMGEQLYQYALSGKGMEKAEEALAPKSLCGTGTGSLRVVPRSIEGAVDPEHSTDAAIGGQRCFTLGA